MPIGWFGGDLDTVERTPVTGWWAEMHHTFSVTVTAALGMGAAGTVPSRTIDLGVTPQFGMAPKPHHAAGFPVTVTPALTMGAPHPAGFGMSVAPALGMDAAERYSGNTFGLLVTPSVGMTGDESFKQQFELTVAPALGMTVNKLHYAAAVSLSVTPALLMEPQGFSDSSFALGVSPTFSVTAKHKVDAALPLTVTPAIGMAGKEHYKSTAFGLTVTPSVGMTGKEHYDRTVGLAVTPTLGFTGTGHNGVALSIIGTPTTASSTSVSLPTHAVGDLIIIIAYQQGNLTIGKPTATGTVPTWTDIDNPVSGIRTAQCVATATNHTSGSWSNATRMTAIVLRGQAASPIGGHATNSGVGTTVPSPAITLVNSDGTSVVLDFHGTASLNTASWDAAPAGYTRLAAISANASPSICLNSQDVTTSAGGVNQGTTNASAAYRGATIEICAH